MANGRTQGVNPNYVPYNQNSSFGSLSFNETDREFVGLPIEDIKSTNALLDKQYHESKQAVSKLETFAKNVDVFNVDDPKKRRALNNLQKRIKKIRESDKFEYAASSVVDMSQDLMTDEGLRKSMLEKKKFEDYKIKMKEYGLQAGWSNEEIQMFVDTAKEEYEKSGGVKLIDPKTSEVLDYTDDNINRDDIAIEGEFKGYYPGAKLNRDDYLNKILASMKADTKYWNNRTESKDGKQIITSQGHRTGVTEEEVRSYVENHKELSADWERYNKDMTVYYDGIDEERQNELLDQKYNRLLEDMAGNDPSKISKAETELNAILREGKSKGEQLVALDEELSIRNAINAHSYLDVKNHKDVQLTAAYEKLMSGAGGGRYNGTLSSIDWGIGELSKSQAIQELNIQNKNALEDRHKASLGVTSLIKKDKKLHNIVKRYQEQLNEDPNNYYTLSDAYIFGINKGATKPNETNEILAHLDKAKLNYKEALNIAADNYDVADRTVVSTNNLINKNTGNIQNKGFYKRYIKELSSGTGSGSEPINSRGYFTDINLKQVYRDLNLDDETIADILPHAEKSLISLAKSPNIADMSDDDLFNEIVTIIKQHGGDKANAIKIKSRSGVGKLLNKTNQKLTYDGDYDDLATSLVHNFMQWSRNFGKKYNRKLEKSAEGGYTSSFHINLMPDYDLKTGELEDENYLTNVLKAEANKIDLNKEKYTTEGGNNVKELIDDEYPETSWNDIEIDGLNFNLISNKSIGFDIKLHDSDGNRITDDDGNVTISVFPDDQYNIRNTLNEYGLKTLEEWMINKNNMPQSQRIKYDEQIGNGYKMMGIANFANDLKTVSLLEPDNAIDVNLQSIDGIYAGNIKIRATYGENGVNHYEVLDKNGDPIKDTYTNSPIILDIGGLYEYFGAIYFNNKINN